MISFDINSLEDLIKFNQGFSYFKAYRKEGNGIRSRSATQQSWRAPKMPGKSQSLVRKGERGSELLIRWKSFRQLGPNTGDGAAP